MRFSEYKIKPVRALLCADIFAADLGLHVAVRLAALNLPSRFDGGTTIRGVSYGPQPWQNLDIYIPEHAKNKNLDVVVFFYGGRWTSERRAITISRLLPPSPTAISSPSSPTTANIRRLNSRPLSKTAPGPCHGPMTT